MKTRRVTKVKNPIAILLCAIIAASLMCINVFAAKTYTCSICHTTNSATRQCYGTVVSNLTESLVCPYRNEYILGTRHLGDCMMIRVYCETFCYCSACGMSYDTYTQHIHEVTHNHVDGGGMLTANVCSTYLDYNGYSNRSAYISFKEYADIVLSGHCEDELK